MDPLLPLTIAAVGIAVLARYRSRLDRCSILGGSLALALLTLITHVILRDNHPYTPDARILSDIAVAIFHESALARTAIGNEVELAVDTLPGRVLKGSLREIVSAAQASAKTDSGEPSKEVLALIDLQLSSYGAAFAGARAQVAVYTRHWHYFGIVRRVLLRMHSWQNYLVLHSSRYFAQFRDERINSLGFARS
jgi:hypothetical protein